VPATGASVNAGGSTTPTSADTAGVTTLPSTGAGSRAESVGHTDRSGIWAGAAAVAGAAAWVRHQLGRDEIDTGAPPP
jgi:hypothetical protein